MKTNLINTANIPYRNNLAVSYLKKNKRKSKRNGSILSFIIGCMIAIVFFSTKYISVNAKSAQIGTEQPRMIVSSTDGNEPIEIDLRTVEMTYYTETSNPCANGKMPRNGICAYRKKDIGKCAIIYTMDYEVIGFYEVYDTGFGREESNGNGTIQNGNCVDIFTESDEQGKELIKKYGNKVMIQLVEGKG